MRTPNRATAINKPIQRPDTYQRLPEDVQFITCEQQPVHTLGSRLTLFVWASAVIVAVVAGPFGTFEAMGVAERALYWFVVVSASVLVGYFVQALAVAFAGQDRPVLSDTLSIVLMTGAFAPVVWFISKWFESVSDPMLGQMYLYVFVIVVFVVIMRRLIFGSAQETTPEAEVAAVSLPTEPMPQPRLLRRLKPEMQGEILRLQGSGHHVEVTTDKGSETLRLRLTDAINEMEPVIGYCAHRSHWVTDGSIERVERETNNKLVLVLTNGDRIPVSRKYRPGLEDAGIIQGVPPRAQPDAVAEE